MFWFMTWLVSPTCSKCHTDCFSFDDCAVRDYARTNLHFTFEATLSKKLTQAQNTDARDENLTTRKKKTYAHTPLVHNQSINDEKRPTHLWSSISRRTHSSKLAGSPSTPALDRRLAIRTIDSRNSAKSILPSPLSNVAPPPEPPVTRLRASMELQTLHGDARTAGAPVAPLEEDIQGCCLNFLVYEPALSAPIDKVDLEHALAAADWHNIKFRLNVLTLPR